MKYYMTPQVIKEVFENIAAVPKPILYWDPSILAQNETSRIESYNNKVFKEQKVARGCTSPYFFHRLDDGSTIETKLDNSILHVMPDGSSKLHFMDERPSFSNRAMIMQHCYRHDMFNPYEKGQRLLLSSPTLDSFLINIYPDIQEWQRKMMQLLCIHSRGSSKAPWFTKDPKNLIELKSEMQKFGKNRNSRVYFDDIDYPFKNMMFPIRSNLDALKNYIYETRYGVYKIETGVPKVKLNIKLKGDPYGKSKTY